MNSERLKELVIAAMGNCDLTKMTALSSSVHNGDNTDIPLEFAEKFAELIVRECAEFIHQSDLLCNDEWDFAERDLPGAIKQHFGVE